MSVEQAFRAVIEAEMKDPTIQSPLNSLSSVIKMKKAAEEANTSQPKADIQIVAHHYSNGYVQHALQIGEFICNPFREPGIPLYNGPKKGAPGLLPEMKPI